jgi:hypothetical protein
MPFTPPIWASTPTASVLPATPVPAIVVTAPASDTLRSAKLLKSPKNTTPAASTLIGRGEDIRATGPSMKPTVPSPAKEAVTRLTVSTLRIRCPPSSTT